jgi:hypothetical protein
MKTIYTRKHEPILVDDEDYGMLVKHVWHIDQGYARNRQLGLMHNVIKPAANGLVVDHINQNKLDNQKFNLRHVTPSTNRINSKESKNATGYRGVYEQKPGRFQASVRRDGKNISLGYFNNPQEAFAKVCEFRQNEK